MGDHHDEGYSADGELPLHEVELPSFLIDPTAVTNARFAAFVDATGYQTDAERLGVSAVFHQLIEARRSDVLEPVAGTPWWLIVRGACWRWPNGLLGDPPAADLPVVHVTWNDARAYCAWAGRRLPTEAEWEYAARGGLSGRRFAWGDDFRPEGEWRCNVFQGEFPLRDLGEDGHIGPAPATSYAANGYGLHCMAGNVWEWCADRFAADYYGRSPRLDPRGPDEGPTRVMRGGSYLCHDSYCNRYRVSARSSNTPDSTAGNVGFRCANDVP